MTIIPDTEGLYHHIDQSGITYGPRKLEIFRQACFLRGVPVCANYNTELARVKIFDPCGSWTWYICEWDPDNNIAYGLVKGFESERGDFSLEELSSVPGPLGIGLEVDVYWRPTLVNEL